MLRISNDNSCAYSDFDPAYISVCKLVICNDHCKHGGVRIL